MWSSNTAPSERERLVFIGCGHLLVLFLYSLVNLVQNSMLNKAKNNIYITWSP